MIQGNDVSWGFTPSVSLMEQTVFCRIPLKRTRHRWSRLCCDAVVQFLVRETPTIWATDTLIRNSDERKTYSTALTPADAFDYQALTGYLVERNSDR
jgi:hypothetical protein